MSTVERRSFLNLLKKDYARNLPQGIRSLSNLFKNPGVFYVFIYRFNYFASGLKWNLARIPLLVLGFILQKTYGDFYGIHISRKAVFGGGLKIGHFGGIFVNGGVVAGEDVSISQGVTIGVSNDKEKPGAPVLGNHIYIGPGAIIYGRIKIGNNVRIGPNACVFFDVPDDSVVLAPRSLIGPNDEGK